MEEKEYLFDNLYESYSSAAEQESARVAMMRALKRINEFYAYFVISTEIDGEVGEYENELVYGQLRDVVADLIANSGEYSVCYNPRTFIYPAPHIEVELVDGTIYHIYLVNENGESAIEAFNNDEYDMFVTNIADDLVRYGGRFIETMEFDY